MTLIEEIREFVAFSDALLLQGVRDGTLSIAQAKEEAAVVEKWRVKLAQLEAQYADNEALYTASPAL